MKKLLLALLVLSMAAFTACSPAAEVAEDAATEEVAVEEVMEPAEEEATEEAAEEEAVEEEATEAMEGEEA
jgi:hypothetical protein